MKINSTSARLTVLSMAAMILLGLLILDLINIRSESTEISRLLILEKEADQKETIFHSIESLRKESSAEIEAFERLTLSDDQLVPLIESIEAAGRALDLDLEIASVDKEGGGDPNTPQTIRMELEAAGSWSGVFSLLKAVESLPNRVMLDNVSLRKGESLWHANIKLSLHSFD